MGNILRKKKKKTITEKGADAAPAAGGDHAEADASTKTAPLATDEVAEGVEAAPTIVEAAGEPVEGDKKDEGKPDIVDVQEAKTEIEAKETPVLSEALVPDANAAPDASNTSDNVTETTTEIAAKTDTESSATNEPGISAEVQPENSTTQDDRDIPAEPTLVETQPEQPVVQEIANTPVEPIEKTPKEQTEDVSEVAKPDENCLTQEEKSLLPDTVHEDKTDDTKESSGADSTQEKADEPLEEKLDLPPPPPDVLEDDAQKEETKTPMSNGEVESHDEQITNGPIVNSVSEEETSKMACKQVIENESEIEASEHF